MRSIGACSGWNVVNVFGRQLYSKNTWKYPGAFRTSGKAIWQAGNIQILEEQIVIKPINKRFPLPPIAATVSIASHCCNCLLVGWWKVKSYTASGSCRSANALWRFVICQGLCSFGRDYQFFDGTLWTHLSCQLSCGDFRMAQFAAPVADDLGRKQLCIDQKDIAWWWRQQKLITVREHAYFQSGCNKVFISHTFRAWASWDELEIRIHDR